MNSRYTLNAANARWVSLYDSLYGTDIIESEETGSQKYDPLRGQEVIKFAVIFWTITSQSMEFIGEILMDLK